MSDETEGVRISVIVATRNRPDSLRQCIDSILANKEPSFELLVVDQTIPHTEILADIADPRLRVIYRDSPGKAAALNVAGKAAKGEILALTDDDCVVPPNWLVSAARTMAREPRAAVVFSQVHAAPSHDSDVFIPEFLPQRFRKLHGRLVEPQPSGMGANMMVRRRVFDELGGFEPAIGPGAALRSGDDWEFAFRALKAGYEVIQDPGNGVEHWGARSISKGEVRRLLMNNYFGLGGGLALHLRRGDWMASVFFLRQLSLVSSWVIANVVQRRQSGARRLIALFEGFKAGWLYKPREA